MPKASLKYLSCVGDCVKVVTILLHQNFIECLNRLEHTLYNILCVIARKTEKSIAFLTGNSYFQFFYCEQKSFSTAT